ncbi:MAG: 4Fe-4S binding protein [Chitinispirillaceae bacterium]|nr:4Fe-4S binding protein [Chitinispirillaceae bacterium]
MNYITIDHEECKGCRLCVEFCPKKCIVIGSNINKIGYQYAEFQSGKCTACGICYYVCPEPGTITVVADKDTVESE